MASSNQASQSTSDKKLLSSAVEYLLLITGIVGAFLLGRIVNLGMNVLADSRRSIRGYQNTLLDN